MFIFLSSSTKFDSGVKVVHLAVHRMLLSVVVCVCVFAYVFTTVWASITDPAETGVYLKDGVCYSSFILISSTMCSVMEELVRSGWTLSKNTAVCVLHWR